MRTRTSRSTIGAAAALAVAVLLAGCSSPGQHATGAAPPHATVGPVRPIDSDPATFGTGTALGYRCDELLDATSVAALDPDLEADAATSPVVGSLSAEAVAIQGVACSWTDAPGATNLHVSAAHPDAATLATLKQNASGGTRSTAFGDDVTAFTRGTEVQLFTAGGFWVTADSSLFDDPAQQTAIGRALLEALPAG